MYNLDYRKMKRPLVLTAILTMMVLSSYAQRPFRLTFVANPQFSWLTSDSKSVSNDQAHLGFDYGVEADIFLGNESYALTTGLTMNQTGGNLIYQTGQDFTFAGESLPSGTQIEYRLKYLEMPLAIKLRSKDFGRLNIYAQFGLTNWLNIKSSGTSSDGTLNDASINDEIKMFSMGLNIGFGIEHDLGGNNALTAGVIYNNGFTDVTSNPSVKDNTNLKTLRFRFGFIF